MLGKLASSGAGLGKGNWADAEMLEIESEKVRERDPPNDGFVVVCKCVTVRSVRVRRNSRWPGPGR